MVLADPRGAVVRPRPPSASARRRDCTSCLLRAHAMAGSGCRPPPSSNPNPSIAAGGQVSRLHLSWAPERTLDLPPPALLKRPDRLVLDPATGQGRPDRL